MCHTVYCSFQCPNGPAGNLIAVSLTGQCGDRLMVCNTGECKG
jgi:hypothetical protein